MKFEKCGHFDEKCPCLNCGEKGIFCHGCQPGEDYIVDTDTLCPEAKAYCESGRTGRYTKQVVCVPKYIRDKMHQIAALEAKKDKLAREVETWLTAKGFDTSEHGLRDGCGCGLDELDYGNDVTDALCERIESGMLGLPDSI